MKLNKKKEFDSLITANPDFLHTIERLKKAAPSSMNILLLGENGTGKQTLAECTHNASGQKENPFHTINCPTNEQNFSTKYHNTSGTLFIREIGALSKDQQEDLVRLIKLNPRPRIVASSSQDITQMVKEGGFREELYSAVNELSITLPSLRQRREDIALLLQYYIGEFNAQFNKNVECISNVALSYLINYDWPGNLNELNSIVKTAVALSEREILWLEDIPLKITLTNENLINEQNTSTLSLRHAEKEHILRILNMCRWNKSKAAKVLETSRPRLDRKIKEYKLKKPS